LASAGWNLPARSIADANAARLLSLLKDIYCP
jgi:hypothetical protein